MRTNGPEPLKVGDIIQFLEDGNMFKKGEEAKVLSFSDDYNIVYYNGGLALSYCNLNKQYMRIIKPKFLHQ